MPRIAVLPELVQNQIAAGEVVERPASVVKELVENALDAGARQLRIELELGGLKLVRVSDDGCGMDAEDLALCLLPHATSKLGALADLDHIASLGFRGEALPSIASVARLTITSRPASGAATGHSIEVEGGGAARVRAAGAERGTSVEVRDLFYNTPARRAFAKSTAVELARCLDVVQRIALAHEGVGFALLHDGRRVLDIEPDLPLAGRVRRAFGSELADGLVPVAASERGLALTGYLAPPRFGRRDSARTMWFLNGRPLKDKLLLRVLKEAYRGFDDSGRTPVCFLHLRVDPAQVDVNVHPTKSEVRFRNERAVFAFCLLALRAALASADLATPGAALVQRLEQRSAAAAGASATLDFEAAPQARERAPVWLREPEGLLPARAPSASGMSAAEGARGAGSATDASPRSVSAAGAAGLQVARSYLVRALPDGFEVIDQHALHERITYEELRAELALGPLARQRLLVPELVELSREELQLIAAHSEALRSAGLELEPFGDTTLAVHALPARLPRPRPAAIVRDLVSFLHEHERAPSAAELLEAALQRAACRSSVMAGDALAPEEIASLIERGRALESDQTCVHGRPTRVRFSLADLERAFHRR